jgi:hypothetical protein
MTMRHHASCKLTKHRMLSGAPISDWKTALGKRLPPSNAGLLLQLWAMATPEHGQMNPAGMRLSTA